LSLERQYQEDVGVLAALFFNYVKLSPGEALYIGANEPHALGNALNVWPLQTMLSVLV
jgi:mannose-6-phosphate isomerase class I